LTLKIHGILFDYGETLMVGRRPWKAVKARGIRAAYDFVVDRVPKFGLSFTDFSRLRTQVKAKHNQVEIENVTTIPDVLVNFELVSTIFGRMSRQKRVGLAFGMTDASWDVTGKNVILRDGAKECLQALRNSTMKVGLVSNTHNSRAVYRQLLELDILRYLDCVVTSDMVGVAKPSPRIFRLAALALGVSVEECLFVGDSQNDDIRGATDAGMRAILLSDASPSQSQSTEESRRTAPSIGTIDNLMDILTTLD
jgi:HAD superfamily hydrolase (TIGR01509 family)